MFKPQHPHKQKAHKGERKNKPRRVETSQTERVKLTQFSFNQRKTPIHKTTHKKRPSHKPRQNSASIFGTLLSSQESHAHQHHASQRRIGATVQTACQATVHITSPIRYKRAEVGASGGALAGIHCKRPKPVHDPVAGIRRHRRSGICTAAQTMSQVCSEPNY